MARIRSVHPRLFTDEAFMSCSAPAQVLIIGIWTEADDYGAFEWKPITLKARILPAHNVNMEELLGELEANNMIARYQHNGKWYGAVRNFARFQRPKKAKSVYFMPPEFCIYADHAARDARAGGKESPTGGEPDADDGEEVPPSSGTVPKRPGIAPQMEDGGSKKERIDDETSSGSRATARPAEGARTGDEAASALIEAADRVIAEHYGRRRPRPHREDLPLARSWADRGITPDRLAAILDRPASRFAEARPHDMPNALKVFASDVDREEPASPYPPGVATTDDRQWFDRVTAWSLKSVWPKPFGPPPNDPETRVPDHVLAARGLTRRRAVAA